jgi:AbrB family transcriptional regulator (stage V sporulation protein T)
MKATGIVRRTDELGRVVIPKEIRKQLGIRDGEPLEIYLDKTANGHPVVCFAKYSTTFENDLADLTAQIANGMDNCGEYELSDKFRDAIKEAAKILKEFENRG